MKRIARHFQTALLLVLPLLLLGQERQICQDDPYNLVLPFMGHWKEYTITDDGEVYMGTLSSVPGPGGCTITQNFQSADGSFSYRSFGYVEASTGKWKEIYVFSNGKNAEYQWLRDGTDIIMYRTGGSRKLEYEHQLRLTDISPDYYDVVEEHSFDGGKSWTEVELTRIKKVK